MIASPDLERGHDKYAKVILTSRPIIGEVYHGNDFLSCRLSIDENQLGYSEDLQIYIRHRVDELSRRRNWAKEMTLAL